MTDLSALHDDEIVAEMQRRLDRGTVGFHGLYSREQQEYRNNWWALCQWIHDRMNDGEFARYVDVQGQIASLANSKAADAPGVFAVNTTYYGVDARQDHAPKQDAA